MMKKADRDLVKRIKSIRELLKEFGATAYGYDPGVLAHTGRGNGNWGESLCFSGVEWSWMEPLLVELREARKLKSEK
jgi:hypothetical protein